jgi:prepilin peptidase CpaA
MEFEQSIELTRVLLVLALVSFCCITDIGMRRIPNAVLLPTLISALFINALGGGMAGFIDSLGGLLVGILILMPMYVLGRMGAGDLKLLGVVGALLGTWGALVAGLATMMAGGVLGIAYLVWLACKPAVLDSARHLAGILKRAPVHSPRKQSSAQTVRAAEIPYALAIAAGAVAAMVYTGLMAGVIIP